MEEESKPVFTKKGKKKREKKSDKPQVDNRVDNRKPVTKENDAFVKYYQKLDIIGIEEWNTFMDTLRQPLDIAFRISDVSIYKE